MTGPHSDTESPGTRPISVAELLAKNGTIGAPAVTRRRRRRRGDSDAVTVAELTGEIPVIRDDEHHPGDRETPPAPEQATAITEERSETEEARTAYWSEPEPRWPPTSPTQPHRAAGPERSAYPRPPRRAEAGEGDGQSGAEDMSPDPMDPYANLPVDVMDSEVHEAEPDTDDSAYVRSYLGSSDSTLFGGQTLADEIARRGGTAEPEADEPHVTADRAAESHGLRGRLEAVWRGTVVVLQSVLAVAFGAGLFVAFDQLWRWNSIVALVLSVLVILGLVVGVRVVRKTEDIASTLIAVAVGALITLGPLALSLQSG
ncbi:hypothetical protein [Mycobacterium sp. Marseille-P9652]|uniref:hypothetical protein n=1 Tax=Mycobacterium sp. Marseille-P9652 TaxID=2654950 RepID=UPI0012E7B65E|nr:hypothetical protein [Mycobacterium sp. Marseille-P9652]